MRRLFFLLASLFVWVSSCAQVATYDPLDKSWVESANERIEKERKGNIQITIDQFSERELKGLKVVLTQTRHSFSFGSAVSARWLLDTTPIGNAYQNIVEDNFNEVVFEDDLKWNNWKKDSGKNFDISQTLNAIDWLREREIAIRGHYLALARYKNYDSFSNVLTNQQYSDPELFKIELFNHIDSILKSTSGDIIEWDAINHIVTSVNSTITHLDKVLGKNIYWEILEHANKVSPESRLFLNEGHILHSRASQRALARYYEISETLISQNANLHGIGFMSHFRDTDLPAIKHLEDIFFRFSNLNLALKITEFDVRFGEQGKTYKFSADELELQKQFTEDFLRLCFSIPKMEGIILWGFWEGRHWYPSAALWDKNWNIKPNGQAWLDLVYGEWWTKESIALADDGVVKARGFLGDYEVCLFTQDGDEIYRSNFKLTKEGVDLTIDLNQLLKASQF